MHARDNAFSPAFWREFANQYWEKQPVVLRGVMKPAFAAPAEVLAALTQAADVPHSAKAVWLDGQPVVPKREMFPLAGETAMGPFVERAAPGHDLCIVQYEIQVVAAPLWLRARDFLYGLFQQIGVPPKVDLDVFYGRYRATPRGPHTDSASNFSFPIQGPKTMLAWPGDFFASKGVRITTEQDDKKRDLDPAVSWRDFVDEAVVLEAEPGDITYWPSSYWHVAVSDSSRPTLVVNLALYVDRRRSTLLAQSVSAMLDRVVEPGDRVVTFPFDPTNLQGSAAMPPQALAAGFELLGRRWADEIELQWLSHITGFGFRAMPLPMAQATLDDGDVVQGDPRYPIVQIPKGDRLVFAANGALFFAAAHPRVVRLLERLNSGEPWRVSSLISDAGEHADGSVPGAASPGLRRLLESLYAYRAIIKTDAARRPDGAPAGSMLATS